MGIIPSHKTVIKLWRSFARLMIVCAAFAQMAPVNGALANVDGDLTFVICAVGEAKVFTWEDMTGEPAPSDSSTALADEHCDACLTACRVKAPIIASLIFLPGVDLHHVEFVEPQDETPTGLHAAGPPLPSRSPPLKAV